MFTGRLKREANTVFKMIELYCRGNHGTHKTLCSDCESLKLYVIDRLSNCRFAANKPTCANCPVHCYRKSKQAEIKKVMRYAGPRMIYRHPWLAVRHLLDGRKTQHTVEL